RAGQFLTVSHDDGAPDTLKKLGSFEVGAEPVEFVRLGANPERRKHPIDVRIDEVTVKAEGVKAAAEVAAAPPQRSRRLVIFAVTLAALVVAAGAAFACREARARRRRQGNQPAGP